MFNYQRVVWVEGHSEIRWLIHENRLKFPRFGREITAKHFLGQRWKPAGWGYRAQTLLLDVSDVSPVPDYLSRTGSWCVLGRECSGMIHSVITLVMSSSHLPSNPSIPYVKRTSKLMMADSLGVWMGMCFLMGLFMMFILYMTHIQWKETHSHSETRSQKNQPWWWRSCAHCENYHIAIANGVYLQ